ncbi:MAG: hypothetical protein K940chlam8_00459 [Chlamydiae bacterium]|nr:hypothetical protein [Chlamydiota bacterium]
MHQKCLCHSNKPYEDCCKPFHLETQYPDPVQLMRSRFSAYALGLVNYIIETTHKEHPDFKKDLDVWKEEIEFFCEATEFVNLKIMEKEIFQTQANVTFIAYLKQDGNSIKLFEKSLFLKENERWLYHSGQVELLK